MNCSDNKKFIILQEDDKGFSFNGRRPSGYTKIEAKDLKFKITYYVQNLNIDGTYGLNLILKNDSKVDIISIGDAKTDGNGKIDISYDFDETMLDDVCGSAICFKDTKGDVKFPLSGFLPKKRILNWKVAQVRLIKNRPFKKESHLMERKKESVVSNEKKVENELIEISECDLNDEGEKITEDNTFSECEKSHDDCIENDQHENEIICMLRCDNSSEDFDKEEENELEEYEEVIKGIIDTSKEVHDQARYHIEALRNIMNNDNGSIERMLKNLFPDTFKNRRNIKGDYEYRFFLNVLSDYEEIESLDFDKCRLFKVHVSEFSEMENMKRHDNVKYTVIYYPMICMYPYFKNKGYFIVGIKYDEEDEISNLLYGVEVDRGMEKIFPYDGITGFNKYVYDYSSSKGYHVMEYDYKKCVLK